MKGLLVSSSCAVFGFFSRSMSALFALLPCSWSSLASLSSWREANHAGTKHIHHALLILKLHSLNFPYSSPNSSPLLKYPKSSLIGNFVSLSFSILISAVVESSPFLFSLPPLTLKYLLVSN